MEKNNGNTSVLSAEKFARAVRAPIALVRQLIRERVLEVDSEGNIDLESGRAAIEAYRAEKNGRPSPTPSPPKPRGRPKKESPVVSAKEAIEIELLHAQVQRTKAQAAQAQITAARRAGQLVLVEDVVRTWDAYLEEVGRAFETLAVELVTEVEDAETWQEKVDAAAALIDARLQKMADLGSIEYRTGKNKNASRVAMSERINDEMGLRD